MVQKHTPTLYQRSVMVVTLLIALWIGLLALNAPEQLLEAMQMASTGAAGLNETRGQYGGFFLALAVFLGLGIAGQLRPAAVFMVLLVLYGGVFSGRVIHLALGNFSDFSDYPMAMKAIHFVDFAGFIASGIGLRRSQ
ncbi:MAG: DUF4345 family protein [Pseudomonadota bacterium]